MIRGVSRASLDTLRAEVERAHLRIFPRPIAARCPSSSLRSGGCSPPSLVCAAPSPTRRRRPRPARTSRRPSCRTRSVRARWRVVQTAVRQRWSSPWDLVDSIEQIADDVLLYDAEAAGSLGEIEDELFRFERILEAEPQLTTLLDSAAQPTDRRVELLRTLVSGKVTPITMLLLEHAIRSGRRRGITAAIGRLLEDAAARQDRSIARVISAVPLTDAQESRLIAVLSEYFRRRISVRTAVEPAVRGGLMIRIGDEVIDGTVSTRLAHARNAVAG